ncbi:nucleotidyltransferase domain-containing protein [Paenibacillus herberti]|uniref:Amino acid transporter n=1 Tax=Paenibacillus herberti TaxID=1619309 RepID=A0A229P4K4_9BACL|nr:hypothetical protein [Paenibacillus herberti]OXM17040.1 hypothetical protein CGZ75_10545 [Paenibacillus herberti]
MRTDYSNWTPITVAEVRDLFDPIPVWWAIAGGWALDLHIGHQTRKHSDTDIVFFRDEQEAVFDRLSQDWLIYKAESGKLSVREPGEYLATTKDIWVCKDENSPWAFQLMIIDREQDEWVYRRERSIRRNWTDIRAFTTEGTPYLKPELQLLYKGGSTEIREKDQLDFERILPHLIGEERQWLSFSLQTQFPQGHPWTEVIKSYRSR